jgi:hypothetical protein
VLITSHARAKFSRPPGRAAASVSATWREVSPKGLFYVQDTEGPAPSALSSFSYKAQDWGQRLPPEVMESDLALGIQQECEGEDEEPMLSRPAQTPGVNHT